MATNLVDFLRGLFFSPEEAAKFKADPSGYMEEHGIESASYEEINEAVVLACDAPVSQGAVVNTGGASAHVGSGSMSSAPAAPAPPPPPPPPPADMPPAQAMEQVVNYYVTEITEVTEVTNVDDRDTNVDNSVLNNVIAEEGSDVDIVNDNDTVTASGDGAVAAGEDVRGAATGDGAVAAGDDVNGNVNTGTNTGVIGDDADIDDSIFGDGNTQINDNEGNVAVGDGNVQANDGSQAAGDDLTDNDIDISNSDLDAVNFGDGGTAVQDNDTTIVTEIDNSVNDSFDVEDSFNTDNSVNDSFDVEDSLNTTDSFNADIETDIETTVETTVEDNDGIDVL